MAFMFAAVEIDQSSRFMDQLRDGRNLLLEKSQRVRVCDHEDSRAIVELGFEIFKIDISSLTLDLYRVEPSDCSTGGIGAVWRDRGSKMRVLFWPLSLK
jgi:hypothetical protein